MSVQYDKYLADHKENVVRAYEWLEENLPNWTDIPGHNAKWNVTYAHDASKSEPEEYDAYDAYFYGGNRSYKVVQNFNMAWLHHIHKNPHHWQHWVLINDDPEKSEICLDMPYDYILEMICDWWSFSWKSGNLYEIFNWYDEHKAYMKLSDRTRRTVEALLADIESKLNKLGSAELMHHGAKGQKWGVKNGPPYPISRLKNAAGMDIIEVEHTELNGPPNGITQITGKNGGIERNYYNSSGWQFKQISNNDHGFPKYHPYGMHGEHAHDYIYDADGNLVDRTTRELTDDERKENGDIL